MLKAFSKELEAAMQEMEEKIFAQTGARFNLNSPAQLGDILFERLKLSHGRKTATGKYSTSEDVLVQLAATHEVPAMVLEYRSLAKLKSTYVDAFPQMVDAENRIHTTFNQAVAATGRLSSSNPNLQNIPIRTEKGQEVRKAFIAAPGHVLISADYSQIELRIIAELSGDEAMMEAFVSGEDIHALTAKGIFGLKTIDEVTREHRRKAKEVNFGIPYGVSAYGLAQRLGLKNDEGKEIIKAYFTRFPKVKDYINTSVQFARDHGYVTTLTGRRRTIPGIHSRNVNERGFAERTAINTPIQGSAADLIKLAMISVFSALEQAGLKTRMVLQIHDELLFEAPEEEVAQALPIIRKAMETAMPLKVPIVADIGTGKTWLEAH
jgi:DNA polymerase-1